MADVRLVPVADWLAIDLTTCALCQWADGSPLLDQDAASEPATADGGPRMSARLSDDSGTANLLQVLLDH